MVFLISLNRSRKQRSWCSIITVTITSNNSRDTSLRSKQPNKSYSSLAFFYPFFQGRTKKERGGWDLEIKREKLERQKERKIKEMITAKWQREGKEREARALKNKWAVVNVQSLLLLPFLFCVWNSTVDLKERGWWAGDGKTWEFKWWCGGLGIWRKRIFFLENYKNILILIQSTHIFFGKKKTYIYTLKFLLF